MSGYWRSASQGLVIRLIVDAVVAALLTYLFAGDGNQLSFFLVTVAVLIFAPIVFAMKSGVAKVLSLVVSRSMLRETFFLELKQNEMPRGTDLPFFDADAYLAHVTSDEEMTPRHRMKATEIASSLATTKHYSTITTFFLYAALEGALRDYLSQVGPKER